MILAAHVVCGRDCLLKLFLVKNDIFLFCTYCAICQAQLDGHIKLKSWALCCCSCCVWCFLFVFKLLSA